MAFCAPTRASDTDLGSAIGHCPEGAAKIHDAIRTQRADAFGQVASAIIATVAASAQPISCSSWGCRV